LEISKWLTLLGEKSGMGLNQKAPVYKHSEGKGAAEKQFLCGSPLRRGQYNSIPKTRPNINHNHYKPTTITYLDVGMSGSFF
jgi:hypothetical protein